MRFGRSAGIVFAAVLLCGGSGSGHAAASEVLAPGYRPALDTEEGGLWAEMDRQEAEVKVSPALVTDEALNTYVRKVVCELAGEYCASLRVYIVDDPGSERNGHRLDRLATAVSKRSRTCLRPWP